MLQRTCPLAAGLGISTMAALILLNRTPAQPARPGNAEAAVARADQPVRDDQPSARVQLPIGQVVLFSSGVGYFQREGTVEGNSRVDLSFPVTDINDLLKSMVLRDLDGGRISTVSYDSNAPVERTLKSFAINLTGNPNLGQILDQARGEKVEVVLQQGNNQPGTLTGTVIGIENQQVAAGNTTVNLQLLNLWCADGMRSLKMPDVQRIRFLNPVMDSEFRKALETLALSHDTQKKAVSINFEGNGKRNVRVGYVVENPIWKTSYRLVLGGKEKPYLQGWAVVENPTDEDWKDVCLTLVSGRPISFKMDLYEPLYVPRPVVEPELFASLRPPAYSGALVKERGGKDREERTPSAEVTRWRAELEKSEKLLERGIYDKQTVDQIRQQLKNAERLQDVDLRASGVGSAAKSVEEVIRQMKNAERLHGPGLASSGVGTAATAAKLGDFFQYVINRRVSLPRQKSAMLPIVARDIEAARVSIYNEGIQAKFPLLGVRLKNSAGTHLNQGPITVFDGGSYAGDARILDLQPNEERLISFAIDLSTEVNPVSSSDNGKLTIARAVKGILYTTTVVRESKTYMIVNRNDAERTVLIEHPVRNEFTLKETDKPLETASDFYRFQVKVPQPARRASRSSRKNASSSPRCG